MYSVSTVVCDDSFSYHWPGTATRTSPTGAATQQHEPHIDPKYLPPLNTVTTTTSVGMAAPGVSIKGEGGHVGGVSPLVAAYLTDNP